MVTEIEDLPHQLGLNDQVYVALKNAIMHHTLPTGYKLDVNALTKRWGISRTPVNDALQRLMIEGLVSVVPRRGTFVASIDVKDRLELLDVRLMFELRAAELVIAMITAEQKSEMRTLLAKLANLINQPTIDFREYSQTDLQLHALPISWTNNEKLIKLYEAQNFQWYMTRAGRTDAGHLEHEAICRAYEEGDLAAIKQAITLHHEAGKTAICELYENKG